MKPQEATRIMKIALAEVEWEYPMDYAAAFETAIEALEKRRDCSKCRRQKYCTKACREHARAISRYMTETE